MFYNGNHLPEVVDFGSTLMLDNLVFNPFSHISYTDPLEGCLEYFGIKFDNDTFIKKVNALLDSILLMDVTNEIVNTKLLPDDEWTHDGPKEPPIFDIKRWPP